MKKGYIKYWFWEPLKCADGTLNHKWVSGSAKIIGKTKKGIPMLLVETRQCKECGLIEELPMSKDRGV